MENTILMKFFESLFDLCVEKQEGDYDIIFSKEELEKKVEKGGRFSKDDFEEIFREARKAKIIVKDENNNFCVNKCDITSNSPIDKELISRHAYEILSKLKEKWRNNNYKGSSFSLQEINKIINTPSNLILHLVLEELDSKDEVWQKKDTGEVHLAFCE